MTTTGPTDAAEPERTPGDATTRVRLLDAAITIAGTRGLDKVTYRSVGEHVGMSHSLVRFYFGTRDELLAQAFDRAARRDAAEGHLLSDDIDSFADALISTFGEHAERPLLQYDYLLHAVRGSGSLPDVEMLYDHYTEQIAGTLRNVGVEDPDGSVAQVLLAALDGMMLQHVAYGSVARTTAMLEQLRRVLTLLRASSWDAEALPPRRAGESAGR